MVRRGLLVCGIVASAIAVAACGSSSSSGGSGGSGASGSGASGASGGSSGSSNSSGPIEFTQIEGAAAEGAADFAKGVAIAVNQINAAGGINGRKLVLKTVQGGLTADSEVAAYRSVGADSSSLNAYLEGTTGVDAVAAQAPRVQVPIQQQAGNAALVNPAQPYVYSMSFDHEYPDSVIKYAMQYDHAKKFAILHYTDDYSSGITASVQAFCKVAGCTVVDSESAAATASVSQLTAALEKMKNSGADAYYIETLDPNAPKAARQLGMFDKPVISEQWLSVPAIAAATGSAGEDITFAAQTCLDPSLASPSNPIQALCKNYIAAWNKAYPGQAYALFSIYGHDAVECFVQAVKQVLAAKQPLTRANVNEQLQSIKGTITTSQGKVETSPTQHHLTGSFGDGGYLLYNLHANGSKITYTLAPHASPDGATATP